MWPWDVDVATRSVSVFWLSPLKGNVNAVTRNGYKHLFISFLTFLSLFTKPKAEYHSGGEVKQFLKATRGASNKFTLACFSRLLQITEYT